MRNDQAQIVRKASCKERVSQCLMMHLVVVVALLPIAAIPPPRQTFKLSSAARFVPPGRVIACQDTIQVEG